MNYFLGIVVALIWVVTLRTLWRKRDIFRRRDGGELRLQQLRIEELRQEMRENSEEARERMVAFQNSWAQFRRMHAPWEATQRPGDVVTKPVDHPEPAQAEEPTKIRTWYERIDDVDPES